MQLAVLLLDMMIMVQQSQQKHIDKLLENN